MLIVTTEAIRALTFTFMRGSQARGFARYAAKGGPVPPIFDVSYFGIGASNFPSHSIPDIPLP